MRNAIGIDIGSFSVKLIELEDKRGRYSLVRCGLNPVVNGDTRSALEQFISKGRLPSRRVNISISGSSAIVRYIEMPPMKKEELRSAIKFEASKYLPFDINDCIIDCAMLDRTSSGSQRVLLAAVKKNEVDRLLGLFKELGLEVNVIDIDSFALVNSFNRAMGKKDGNETCALINLGARFSNMNIIMKGDIYFTRDVLWGGMDITERIKSAMGINLDEAEALKQRPAEKRQDVVNVTAPVLERFTSQIRMSFDYFESQFGKVIEGLYISGGSSYLFNIVDFLKENLGVNVAMWNPFEGISILEKSEDLETWPAIFAVALGLALRS